MMSSSIAVWSRPGTLCRSSRPVNRDGTVATVYYGLNMALPPRIILPNTPALAVGLSAAGWLDPTGEIEELPFEDTAKRLKDGIRPLLCHGPGTADRLSLKRFQCFDVLELFAFVRPLNFCVPTPRGLGDALQIDVGPRPADAALGLVQATQALLNELVDSDQVDTRPIAWAMAQGGWSWGPSVLARSAKKRRRSSAVPCSRADVGDASRNGLNMRRHRRLRLMGRAGRGAPASSAVTRQQFGGASEPGGLCICGSGRLPAERSRRRAERYFGRGGYRGRKDTWLHRAGKRLGRKERGTGLALDLYSEPSAPD